MSMSMITMIMMMIPTNRDPWVNWRLAPRWLTAVALPSKSPSPSNYNTGPIARHAILADFLRLFFLENALTAWSRICSGVARHRLISQSRLVGQLLVVSSKHFYQKSVVVHHLLCNRPVHLDYPDHLQNCQTWPSFLQYVGISRWAGSFAKKILNRSRPHPSILNQLALLTFSNWGNASVSTVISEHHYGHPSPSRHLAVRNASSSAS